MDIGVLASPPRASQSHGDSQHVHGAARPLLAGGEILHLWPLWYNQINVTAMATLDSKADLELAIPPTH